MNDNQLADFINSSTPEQRAVFNNNSGGRTIAWVNEGSISESDRNDAMDAASYASSANINVVNLSATGGKLKEEPC